MSPIFCISLVLGLSAQQPASALDPGDPAKRLAIMKGSLARCELWAADSSKERYRLRPEPVLRFTNTMGDSRDGTIFLWLGDGDRPAAAVQVFQTRGGWVQEWTSLSPAPLIAKMSGTPDWKPARGGIELKPVPGAPTPARDASERVRQLHTLARNFTARDFFRGTAWQPLRLMPKPLARYGKPGSEVVDGALFAFVLTTDPEALLMIESRKSKDGLEWRYAFAPMSCYPLEGSCKERLVWRQDYLPTRQWDSTFYQLMFEPKE
jgi:hypothetical protein